MNRNKWTEKNVFLPFVFCFSFFNNQSKSKKINNHTWRQAKLKCWFRKNALSPTVSTCRVGSDQQEKAAIRSCTLSKYEKTHCWWAVKFRTGNYFKSTNNLQPIIRTQSTRGPDRTHTVTIITKCFNLSGHTDERGESMSKTTTHPVAAAEKTWSKNTSAH